MVGGCQPSNDSRDFILLPYTRQIDANLNVIERAPMKTARSSVPLALIRDRWILAMGGNVARNKPCSLVAAYDTLTNVWFECQSLTTVKSNTSAVVVSSRFVYLLPGPNIGAQKGNSVMIDYLDTGVTQDYMGSHDTVQYGMQIAKRNWESLEVRDPTFCR